MSGWIGVDLDGTLAWHGDNFSILKIGVPIREMVNHIAGLLAAGNDVRIFTARVARISNERALEALRPLTQGECHAVSMKLADLMEWNAALFFEVYQRRIIEEWCVEHLGRKLLITAEKDFDTIRIYDDRAVQVVTNTGIRVEVV